MILDGWWLPPELRRLVGGALTRELVGGLSIRLPLLEPAALTQLARALRARAEDQLRALPVAEIAAGLDAASARWLDDRCPERARALEALPALTGFSRAMVAESLDLEMRSSRAGHILSALRSELGDPAALDGFVPAPHLGAGGRTRALGPGLVGAVFSSNIPGLPHLSVMRALSVKAAFIGRCSSAEPVFLPLYLETLHRVAPALAACCAALSWDRAEGRLEAALLEGVDFFTGWGGPEAEAHFRAAAPPGLPLLFHGHRLGFAALSREATAGDLRPLGRALALDVTRFDQRACLAPHAIFVEGSTADAVRLADAVAEGLSALAEVLPPGRRSAASLADLQQRRAVAELVQALGTGALRIPADRSSAWTVVVDQPASFPVSPLDRFITLVPISGLRELVDYLQPLRGLLQNAALAAPGPRGDTWREALARLGVSRLCPPGQMATPSMMWHHDGTACLGAMVRWCDEELTPPAPEPPTRC